MLIDKVVIHATDSPPSLDIGTEEIDQWHRDKGWSAIGYHRVIRRDGTIENGRDLDGDGDVFDEVGAHAYGFNRNSIGIVLVGGYRGKFDFTAAQIASLWQECKSIESKHSPGLFCGHNDLDRGKTCPNFKVSELLKGVVDDARLA